MKFAIFLALAASVLAGPLEPREVTSTQNEFVKGGCRDMILFWARGSDQEGNMGRVPGIAFAKLFKEKYGDGKIAIQGLDYPANVQSNFKAAGTDDEAIKKMAKLVEEAIQKCPYSRIVLGGFNQGAAVIHGATRELHARAVHRITAIVTFGGTRNRRDNKKIPGVSKDKTLLICNRGDIICEDGRMELNAAHSDYASRAREGAEFVFKRLEKSPM